MEPAAVVLNVCVGNDILDNALPVYLYDGATPKPYFTLEGADLRLHDEHVRLRGPALAGPPPRSSTPSPSTPCSPLGPRARARPSTTTTASTGAPGRGRCWSAGRRRWR